MKITLVCTVTHIQMAAVGQTWPQVPSLCKFALSVAFESVVLLS